MHELRRGGLPEGMNGTGGREGEKIGIIVIL